MLAIKQWLKQATDELKNINNTSARLDAEIILAHTLRRSRTYLHAHEDDELGARETEIADARLQLRLEHTPIAYIIGHKEFYGRQFKVTPSVLIPRPESEAMIHLLKKYLPAVPGNKLVDIGTGSGCLGITAKLELPQLDVTLTDSSRHALHVAKTNAKHYNITAIAFLHGDLLNPYPYEADVILANLPYVDESWQRSPETEHEPAVALFASEDGLHLINRLIAQTKNQLVENGLLLLEADPRQHKSIINTAAQHSFKLLEIDNFILALQKV